MLNKSIEIIKYLNPIQLNELNSYEELTQIKSLFPAHTLLPEEFFKRMLEFVHTESYLGKGDWVQIGVWKGGGALFLKALIQDLKFVSKLHLFDTFEGWNEKTIHHSKDLSFIETLSDTSDSLKQGYLNNAIDLFNQFELNSNVEFIKSDVMDLKSIEIPPSISFLHIDVDFFEPIYASLTKFYDNVIQGGFIVIDDYYLNLVNCKEAVDLFIKQNQLENKIEVAQFTSFSLIIKKLH